MPHQIDTTAVLYREDAFKAAGITDVPTVLDDAWTWDEFAANSRKLLKVVKSKQKSKKAYVAGAIESESSGNDDKHQSEEECQEEAATFCKENVSTTSADT